LINFANGIEDMAEEKNIKHNNLVPIQDEIVLYQSEDGNIKVDVLFQDETVWLTQEQMALLFGKARSTINEHIQNIYQEGELQESNSMRKFGNSEFSMKPTNFYNLDVIISVGYRVKSRQGTMFRIWATQRLHDYIIRGYACSQRDRWLARYQKSTSNLHGVDLFFSMSSFSGRLRLLVEGVSPINGDAPRIGH
jgi:hypothetical protein